MPPLSAFTRYTSSFIGATLLTSFAFRGVIHKRTSTAERDRLTAHTTILESLVARLKAGEDVGEAEIGRLLRLARGGGEEVDEGKVLDVPWREVVFGRKVREDDGLADARREWDAGEWCIHERLGREYQGDLIHHSCRAGSLQRRYQTNSISSTCLCTYPCITQSTTRATC